MATFLLYFDAVWALLGSYPALGTALFGRDTAFGFTLGSMGDLVNQLAQLAIVVGGVAAGYLISNEKKIGWFVGIAVGAMPLVTTLLIKLRFGVLDMSLVSLMFAIALIALILHEQSRNYVRIWFK